jgi:hypothetical protein
LYRYPYEEKYSDMDLIFLLNKWTILIKGITLFQGLSIIVGASKAHY